MTQVVTTQFPKHFVVGVSRITKKWVWFPVDTPVASDFAICSLNNATGTVLHACRSLWLLSQQPDAEPAWFEKEKNVLTRERLNFEFQIACDFAFGKSDVGPETCNVVDISSHPRPINFEEEPTNPFIGAGPAIIEVMGRIVRSNGGGIRASSTRYPEIIRELASKGFVQGKSGDARFVVHTRLGLEMWQRFKGEV